jgi:hypothetical protein
LKNAIYHFILNERAERKMPKLKEILYQGIERQKRNKEAKRKKLDGMSLDNMESTTAFLTEEQYIQLQENYEKLTITMSEF